MENALIVVDMQQSLIEDETPTPDEIIEAVGALVEAARGAGDAVVWVTDGRVMPEPGLHPAFIPAEGEIQVVKTTRDAFESTDLDARLKALGVERVVICGMQSDACVDGTTRGAAKAGYEVVLVSDAHTTHVWERRGFRDVIAARIQELNMEKEALTGMIMGN